MPLHILIIDDDEDDVILTRALLEEGMRDSFEVEWADTFDQGRAKLRSARHDVALLDYRLGRNTGIDLLRESVERGSKVPIILLTGLGDHEIDMEGMRAGASDYLQKDTLTPATLERAVRYAIQSRRLERQRTRLVREKAARRAAEAANQAKDNFLALLSHELRTPLNAIANWVQLLELDDARDLDIETLREAIDAIGRNVRLQAQLVDDLLDVSRIVAGKLDLNRQVIDLDQVFADALEGCQTLANTKNITVTTDIDVAAELTDFLGDPTRLQQVLWNLANNAVKFTQEGGTVTVRLTTDDAHVVVRVEDDGPGIHPDDLPYIFDRFRQGTNGEENVDQRNRPGGLGIGLALVRHLVELHGGTVEADSRTTGSNRGTDFTITFPRHGMPEAAVRDQ